VSMARDRKFCPTLWICAAIFASFWLLAADAPPHVIEVLAGKDSRHKIAGERTPEIAVKAREHILLRITVQRGKSWNRDGSIHGFSLLRAKDRSKVPGWDLLLRPGAQEFQLIAPAEPGE
jgi:hypothetical protein